MAFLYRYLFTNADIVIVLSKYWFNEVNKIFHLGEKVKVIYNPCTAKWTSDKYMKRNQILFAGTLNARKGYQDMIKAFAKIATKYPDWKIIFAGNGEIDQGKSLAKSLNIVGQVVFLGWVNGKEKDEAFKESDFFCLPSYAEGFPMAVLDAWAYGLPVITTPVGGIPDVAKDGENMLLFFPGDINKLGEQMEKLIIDGELRKYISSRSLILYKTIFNIDIINKQIENLYKKVIK